MTIFLFQAFGGGATAGTYTPVLSASSVLCVVTPLGLWRWQRVPNITTPGQYIVQVFGTIEASNESEGPDVFNTFFTLPFAPIGTPNFVDINDLTGVATMLETLADPIITDRASMCRARVGTVQGQIAMWMNTPATGTGVWGVSFAYASR